MKNLIFSLTWVVLLTQCGNPAQQEMKALRETVMAVHDSVMPLMDEMMELQKVLKQAAAMDSSRAAEYLAAAKALEAADSAMMSWMNEFDPVMAEMTDEVKTAYLQKERERIEQVAVMTSRALQEARALAGQ